MGGAVRWAYHGECLIEGAWEPYVFKRFVGAADHTRARYLGQIQESSIANFLAEQFNASKRSGVKPIRFLDAIVLQWKPSGGSPEYVCAEETLPGGLSAFRKFSNNAGDWDLTDLKDNSLLEFSKYTFDATGGYMMVSDLQGVDNGTEYLLTDPVILCKDVD